MPGNTQSVIISAGRRRGIVNGALQSLKPTILCAPLVLRMDVVASELVRQGLDRLLFRCGLDDVEGEEADAAPQVAGHYVAQDGVSLHKISAWMGNSRETCRRHCAQFVPRDRHDEDIERL